MAAGGGSGTCAGSGQGYCVREKPPLHTWGLRTRRGDLLAGFLFGQMICLMLIWGTLGFLSWWAGWRRRRRGIDPVVFGAKTAMLRAPSVFSSPLL